MLIDLKVLITRRFQRNKVFDFSPPDTEPYSVSSGIHITTPDLSTIYTCTISLLFSNGKIKYALGKAQKKSYSHIIQEVTQQNVWNF